VAVGSRRYYIGSYFASDSRVFRGECEKIPNCTGGDTMKTINVKRIAAAGAISGALSFAALGLGAGAANADDGGNIPFVPGGSGGDWQSYFPLIERLGDVANLAQIGGTGRTGSTGDTGSLGSLGSLGNLGGGQWQDLLGMLG
jgi:hypothetical protein